MSIDTYANYNCVVSRYSQIEQIVSQFLSFKFLTIFTGKSMFVVFTLIVVVSLNRYVLSTTTCMEALADLFAKNHLMHRCKFTPAGYSASKPSFPWLNPSFQKIERIGRSARFQYGHIELPSVESIGSEDELISLLLGNFFGYCEETNVYFTYVQH